jgi:hypothetical protein
MAKRWIIAINLVKMYGSLGIAVVEPQIWLPRKIPKTQMYGV